jgi:hypothetical protein
MSQKKRPPPRRPSTLKSCGNAPQPLIGVEILDLRVDGKPPGHVSFFL